MWGFVVGIRFFYKILSTVPVYFCTQISTVYPSIGGWSLSDPFPPMAANPTARKNFAQQCVALIKNYNFDGIGMAG
jgi:GH18 family chitinase